MSHGTLQMRYACLITDDLSLPELKRQLFIESLFNFFTLQFLSSISDSRFPDLEASVWQSDWRARLELITAACFHTASASASDPTLPYITPQENQMKPFQVELDSSSRFQTSNSCLKMHSAFTLFVNSKETITRYKTNIQQTVSRTDMFQKTISFVWGESEHV